jgi:hypothetical protein
LTAAALLPYPPPIASGGIKRAVVTAKGAALLDRISILCEPAFANRLGRLGLRS